MVGAHKKSDQISDCLYSYANCKSVRKQKFLKFNVNVRNDWHQLGPPYSTIDVANNGRLLFGAEWIFIIRSHPFAIIWHGTLSKRVIPCSEPPLHSENVALMSNFRTKFQNTWNVRIHPKAYCTRLQKCSLGPEERIFCRITESGLPAAKSFYCFLLGVSK